MSAQPDSEFWDAIGRDLAAINERILARRRSATRLDLKALDELAYIGFDFGEIPERIRSRRDRAIVREWEARPQAPEGDPYPADKPEKRRVT